MNDRDVEGFGLQSLADELAPFRENSAPSTSRDPDSEEWKK